MFEAGTLLLSSEAMRFRLQKNSSCVIKRTYLKSHPVGQLILPL